MIVYSVLMFAAAILFASIAAAVYGGLFILAAFQLFSGIIALLGTAVPIVIVSTGVLLLGIILAFNVIARVQKEFNGGF